MSAAVERDEARVVGVAAATVPAAVAVPKRVVFNGRFLAQSATGVQRYAQETLLAIDALLSGPEAPAEWADTRFELAVPAGARALPRALKRVVPVELKALSRYGHAWEQVTLGWYARDAFLVGFSYSGPVWKRRQLITIHDAAVRAFPESYTRAYRWVHDALVGVLGRTAERVMTVSEFSRVELANRYRLNPRRIVVGHEGWEHALSDAPAEQVRNRFGLEPGAYLLCVGSLKQSKGLQTLADALQLLPADGMSGTPIQLAVAGAADPRLFPSREGASTLSTDSRIRKLGFVSDEELFALYRHAKGLVMPSRYEGFGLPAVEALANGCPVIAAHAAALPEVLGDAAWWFEPGDAASLAALIMRIQCSTAPRLPVPQQHGWRNAGRAVLTTLHRSS